MALSADANQCDVGNESVSSTTHLIIQSTRPAPGGVSRRRMIDIASKLSCVVESELICTRLTGQQQLSSSRTMMTRCLAASGASSNKYSMDFFLP